MCVQFLKYFLDIQYIGRFYTFIYRYQYIYKSSVDFKIVWYFYKNIWYVELLIIAKQLIANTQVLYGITFLNFVLISCIVSLYTYEYAVCIIKRKICRVFNIFFLYCFAVYSITWFKLNVIFMTVFIFFCIALLLHHIYTKNNKCNRIEFFDFICSHIQNIFFLFYLQYKNNYQQHCFSSSNKRTNEQKSKTWKHIKSAIVCMYLYLYNIIRTFCNKKVCTAHWN